MARKPFSQLTTEQFRRKMQPLADEIYREVLFPGCEVKRYKRGDDDDPHVLDQAYGIDMELIMPSGQNFTVQEKHRRHKFLIDPFLQVKPPTPDFTQEYMNAAGTEHESKGEWFHLASQFYFYGWADAREERFEKWVLLDVTRYKMLVEQRGGLDAIGVLRQNFKHGSATFYAIPITDLRDAWVATHKGTYSHTP